MIRLLIYFHLLILPIIGFSQPILNNCKVFDTANSAIPENIIKLLACDYNDNIWFVTGDCFYGGHLVKYDGNTFTSFDSTNSPIKDKFLTAIFVDHENTIWIGTRTSGMYKMYNGKWVHIDKGNSLLPDNHVMDLAETSNHEIWVATDNGLAKLSGENIIVYTTANSPIPDQPVNSLCVDKNDKLWLGTNHGFASLFQDQWMVYTSKNSSLPNDQINVVSTDNLGRIWVIYWWGIVLIDGDNWTISNEENSKIQTYALFKVYHYNQEDWYTTSYGIVVNYRDEWKTYNPMNSCVPSFFINAMAVDSKNRKWFATNDGLLLIE